jgi:holin-like protein
MLRALTLLFLCQLAGETIVRAIGLAFPGPVLGMGLLLAVVYAQGGLWPELDTVADTILRYLSLLFVPAAVGLMQQAGLIAANWLVIGLAVGVSTLLTLVVTVVTFRAVVRLQAGGRS